jgi:2-keto-4-pentenoate hydratase/2-oxohepta-3-ene-1,7-dioic acid hydratase in catechol pathway
MTIDNTEASTGLPIELPSKIICVGLNYRDHAREAGLDAPTSPLVFSKWPNALVGPNQAVQIPDGSTRVDFEAELGVVIGRTARAVDASEALDYVAGYLCCNDITARDLQFDDGQWTRGKSLDTFCPIGPELVPASEVPDPQNLRIQLFLNGEKMQDSNTSEMIFSVAEIISFVSQTATLNPGDLILTGTPAGVGVFRDPPVRLVPGDEVSVEIEGLGTLTNFAITKH